MYGTQLVNLNRQRPYHCEYTGSRPITEVKHSWAWIVLAWVTCWEYQVLLAFCLAFNQMIDVEFLVVIRR